MCAAYVLGASPVCTDFIMLLRAMSAASQKGNRLAKMPKRLECVEMRTPSTGLVVWHVEH